MFLTHPYKSLAASKPWTARILLTLFVLLILLASLRGAMPFVIKSAAISWFEGSGVKATIGEIEIAMFDGRFAINDIDTSSANGKQLSLDRFAVIWQWKPLLDQRMIVPRVEISGVRLDVALQADGEKHVGGLVIKPGAKESRQVEKTELGAPWDIDVQNITIADVDVCLQQYGKGEAPEMDYCVTLAALDWQGDIQFKQSKQAEVGEAMPLYIGGALNLNGLSVQDNKLNLSLLTLGNLGLTPLSVKTLENIEIGEIALNDLTALQRKEAKAENDTQIVSFASLTVKPVKLSQMNDLKLGVIQLDGAQAYFRIDNEGNSDLAYWFPPKPEAEAEKGQTVEKPAEISMPDAADAKDKETGQKTLANKEDSASFRYAFDEFAFNSDKHFLFVDDNLKEPFAIDVHTPSIKLGKLDGATPEAVSHLTLDIKIDRHGELKVDADVSPLAKRPTVKGEAMIAGLDLRLFAPFTKQHIGHNVRSGQLDADFILAVDKGVIDSKVKLALRHFELKALSKKEAKELNSEFGFPLNSSLSLLRDRDNTIRLEIPVAGDIDNPEFDPGDAIKKASSKAITTAVLHYYTPFGLVFAANSLFDLATALNFEPVLLEANRSALSEANLAQLDKLATLLNERPGVHLTLCGVSNAQDKAVLFPVPEKPVLQTDVANKGVTEADTKLVAEKDLALLQKLAGARSAKVKDYLVKQKKVKASRLVECAPEFEAGGISGVEISI